MKVILNKYNYIISYAVIGDIETSIELPNVTENPLDYQYLDGKLLYNPIPTNKPIGINIQYDGKKWIEDSSLEEQEEYLKNLIIEKNKELITIQKIGFTNHSLEKEIDELKNKHAEVSHQLALEIDDLIKK